MNIDEMAKKVGPAKLALLSARAVEIAKIRNRHPEVDQGGQYVWERPEKVLRELLEKEINN